MCLMFSAHNALAANFQAVSSLLSFLLSLHVDWEVSEASCGTQTTVLTLEDSHVMQCQLKVHQQVPAETPLHLAADRCCPSVSTLLVVCCASDKLCASGCGT